MSKQTKNTGVAIVGADPVNLTAILAKELAALKKIEMTPFKTGNNQELPGFGDIKLITDETQLVKALSSERAKAQAYNEAFDVLKPLVDNFNAINVFKIGGEKGNGGTEEDWVSDIALQLNIVRSDSRRKQLEAFMEKSKSFITKEQQFELHQKEVASFLGIV